MDIIGLSEVKKKGNGLVKLTEEYSMIYSGVNIGQRARVGVGFVLKEKLFDRVEAWEPISSRIITMDIVRSIGKVAMIQIYAPIEDSATVDKDQFYEVQHYCES